MFKHYKILLRLIYILVPILPLLCHTYAQEQNRKEVLFLSSYHKGFDWSDDLMEGIESVFREERLDINIQIEYMDTRRIQDERHFQNLFKLYKYKFSKDEFDVIIAFDDNALLFLLKYRKRLFPDIPVVFVGVNFFKDSMLIGHRNITGIVEKVDIKKTIDIALKLHPRTKNIVIISSALKRTGKIILEDTLKLVPDYAGSVEFSFMLDRGAEELKKRIQNLSKDSVIFFQLYYSPYPYKFLSYKNFMDLVIGNSSVPVYALWETRLSYGVVGGMMVTGFYHGKAAGEMAVRIVKGEDADNIPVLKESPNKYMFDFKQFKRFGIKIEELPEGSIIINKPVTSYRIYKEVFWFALSILFILTMSVLILIVNIRKRIRAEKETKRKSEQLSNLHELGNRISSIVSKEELLPWIAEEASKLLDTDECIYRIKEGNYLERGSSTKETWKRMTKERLINGECIIGRISEEKKPIIIEDIREDPRLIEQHKETAVKQGIVSFLGVPMMIGDEVKGVLCVLTKKHKGFKKSDVELLSSFAGMAAIALENARLISDLKQEVENRKKAEEHIQASLEEKELLLKEIHHRVKNNMQVISSMLMLQSYLITNKETIDILKISQERIKSMALVHEKIYETKEMVNINFKDYVETLIQGLHESYAQNKYNIKIEINAEDMFLNIDTAVPLGLIINELATNAMKYAFVGREQGVIKISLKSIGRDKLELIVKDNGVGLSEDFKIADSKSLGLQIVSILVEKQLHGNIEIKTDEGTEFRLVLTKTEPKKRTL